MGLDEGILNIELSSDDDYTTEPVLDEYTFKMAAALRQAKIASPAKSKTVQCACGMLVVKSNCILPDGTPTNSLAVHYLAHHRSKISLEELEKISRLKLVYNPEEEPPLTQKVLTPRKR
ncbi:hypothetical protein A3C91_02430 [Candidatus Azambacteria bacterium RIFCSPHIGHO2_02_FULL_52_12]|uniref:Uncharacterized protein n=1 Tax=Candidatus Azambacteria bacterium RIFCSPLOWO2_01_FULL_46_25 TaxID=1797298 RepID=A0A1F5BVS5_9BACT|nr:MAG: hypothetical protein A3C91_02430 [Candidatus Azambacteria bacterium RIFCSPHIGHO2_02_FULL_52_12]OGD34678.1 MAG: hypothetical protein A2988_04225 [Candidatus Azambacteria bacterium RIFCSPLOWO2_01_FULL_46_25]OGD37448.1 MAG: hypothetical protein A2850_02655 [Candidatus Azambacteria bacterium RIFCSPHIGHO2_01_FULL_51_74]